MNDLSPELGCKTDDVAAYLDGELSGAALARFEDHVKTCVQCAAELRAQRQLLCTLDVAFRDTRSFDLPKNFTRVVTARAESDLSGVRHGSERRRALKLCAILTLVSFGLMGAASRAIVFDPVRSFLRATASVVDLCWHAASETAASTAMVVRVTSRAVLPTQIGAGLAVVLIFFLSISILLFLIAKYRRAPIVE